MNQNTFFGRFTLIAGAFVMAACQSLAPAPTATSAPPTATATRIPPTSTPTITPTPVPPTATATPTRTPNIAATSTQQVIQATATAMGQWPVVLSDTFDAQAHGWWTGSNSGKYATGKIQIKDGKYRWEIRASQGVYWTEYPSVSVPADFSFSVDVQQVQGPDDSDYGLVFRARDDNDFYYFGISDLRMYGLFVQQKGEWETLVDWERSSAIQPGKVNRITVNASGPHFVFFINGKFVAEIGDDQIDKGRVGLAIDLVHPDDQAVFEFDNFEVRGNTVTAVSTPAAGGPPSTNPTRAPVFDYLAVLQKVKSLMEGFGGMIDIALNQTGFVDCGQVVDQYLNITTAPELQVSPDLAASYQLYRSGIAAFGSGAQSMYQNCSDFLANPSGGEIPFQQWGLARQSVNQALEIIRQAIMLAGGTP